MISIKTLNELYTYTVRDLYAVNNPKNRQLPATDAGITRRTKSVKFSNFYDKVKKKLPFFKRLIE